MNTNTNTLPTASGNNKTLWAAVGVLGIAVLALGAGLIYVQNRPADTHTALATSAPGLPPELVASSRQDDLVEPPAAAKPAPAKPAKPAAVASNKPVARAPVPAVVNPPVQMAKAICSNCGTIEAVTPVTRKGTGSGVGTVAGGVVGAVLGNQVGKGDGRALATVLGAVGGGLAGNAIEKNVKKETVYQIRVRMEDGSNRDFENATAPAVGTKVVVEDGLLRVAAGG